ncbi:MAG: hypothetical protein AAGA20_24670 [Planctomycetota bacterium]
MKLIIKLLVLLALALLALGIAGFVLVPPAAKAAVEKGSMHAFGVPATLGSISASPGLSETSVGFKEYSLSSPDGFEEPLLSIGRFQLGVGTTSLLGQPKEVDTLILEDVVLTLTQKGTSNNLVPVLRHLRESQSKGGGTAEPEEAPKDESAATEPGPRLRVGTVRFAGIAARFQLDGIVGLDPIDERFEGPPYERDWSDLTGEDGKTVAEISGLIVEDLKSQAFVAAEEYVPAEVLTALRGTLDGGLEGGLDAAGAALRSSVEGELQEQVDKARDEAKSKLDEALEGIDDDVKKGLDGLLRGGG